MRDRSSRATRSPTPRRARATRRGGAAGRAEPDRRGVERLEHGAAAVDRSHGRGGGWRENGEMARGICSAGGYLIEQVAGCEPVSSAGR